MSDGGSTALSVEAKRVDLLIERPTMFLQRGFNINIEKQKKQKTTKKIALPNTEQNHNNGRHEELFDYRCFTHDSQTNSLLRT